MRIASVMAVAGLAFLAAGCGGTPHSSDVASITNAGPVGCRPHCVPPATASETVAAVKAARCMRTHGVPNFPDPNDLPGLLKGHFGYMVDSGLDPNSPQFKTAMAYCEGRYIHFPKVSPAEKARRNAAALKYSACMRAHGVRDFPDPDGTGAINFPTADYYRTPKVLRGEGACKSLFTGPFVFGSPPP